MSFHEQNLEAFIELLSDKRSRRLFTENNLAELAKMVSALPDDVEKLSIAIATWYETRPTIVDAQLDLLNELLSPSVAAPQKTNPLAIERVSSPSQPAVQPVKQPINKQALQQAIDPQWRDRPEPGQN
ncbi:hypothetical protein QPK87_16115 [Kamptonema cortianum]|uniref:Uncharacterized protein n=1 Tax=Geitlerinema calcuttense NRMC-F 0142 TaxID=2922238 RepID=A0ABT7LYL2_9CYAN|nr:hypothetical protein [Geitlerinema calcuttense]MDI9638105.1 hypothetical protein [Geitlerinema splendidum]MDK3158083.1 hypothetical protein [Kamptonema cortianum]MDL5044714.1 hypothetical protein [Oscillatoria amoena NRMC-F 0135]MDL5057101.1 hypothetical protein [Geitlerinema calcuttense NRMC-F 0142]